MRTGRTAAVAACLLVLVVACGRARTAYTHQADDGPVAGPAIPLARDNRLGPDGFGKLKLGMAMDRALDTGQFAVNEGNGFPACRTGTETGAKPARGGGVWVSAALGVAKLGGYRGVRTPEGIGLGASLDDVRRAYPDARLETDRDMGNGQIDMDDHYRASVPGNASAVYRFFLDQRGVVDAMLLALAHQDCDVGFFN